MATYTIATLIEARNFLHKCLQLPGEAGRVKNHIYLTSFAIDRHVFCVKHSHPRYREEQIDEFYGPDVFDTSARRNHWKAILRFVGSLPLDWSNDPTDPTDAERTNMRVLRCLDTIIQECAHGALAMEDGNDATIGDVGSAARQCIMSLSWDTLHENNLLGTASFMTFRAVERLFKESES